jgi:hypothetical protein
MSASPTFAELLGNLARSLTASFASSVAAQPEDQLKMPVKALLEAASPRRVVARSGHGWRLR